MSYDIDELFRFDKSMGGCILTRYLKKDDPTITELEIPAEYHGLPVARLINCFGWAKYLKRVVIPPSVLIVDNASFYECKALKIVELSEGLKIIGAYAFGGTNLKSIVLPKSLKRLGDRVFADCDNLESVTFNSMPIFMDEVFFNCNKLPADITLMGLVNSCDIGKPFAVRTFNNAFNPDDPMLPGLTGHLQYIRPDVFDLAIKNDCFRSVDISVMLKFFIKRGDAESLRFTEERGLFNSRELVDELIEASARDGETELTAYLLELKKRKLGFAGYGEGDNFEL